MPYLASSGFWTSARIIIATFWQKEHIHVLDVRLYFQTPLGSITSLAVGSLQLTAVRELDSWRSESTNSFSSALQGHIETMPGRRRGTRRGLRGATRALRLGTTLAVAGSSTVVSSHECSAFLFGPTRSSVNFLSRAGGNREALDGTSVVRPLSPPWDMTMKKQGPVPRRAFSADGEWDSEGRQAHSPKKHKRKGRIGPLSGTSFLLHDEPVRLEVVSGSLSKLCLQ